MGGKKRRAEDEEFSWDTFDERKFGEPKKAAPIVLTTEQKNEAIAFKDLVAGYQHDLQAIKDEMKKIVVGQERLVEAIHILLLHPPRPPTEAEHAQRAGGQHLHPRLGAQESLQVGEPEEDVLDLLGIELGPVRLKCALLSLKVLKAGVYGLGEASDDLLE